MGVGKSTVGQRCAELARRRFVDTDALIVERIGMPLNEAFAIAGETALRDIEQTVVTETVASREPLVIACGGGTVVRPDNREMLRTSGFVVWLRAPTSVLVRRIGRRDGRPLLSDDPRRDLDRLYDERAAAYAAAADAVIEVDGSVDAVATEVLSLFDSEFGATR